ncbi:hypothetical protein ACLOJK_029850 [Asimina triloba]
MGNKLGKETRQREMGSGSNDFRLGKILRGPSSSLLRLGRSSVGRRSSTSTPPPPPPSSSHLAPRRMLSNNQKPTKKYAFIPDNYHSLDQVN